MTTFLRSIGMCVFLLCLISGNVSPNPSKTEKERPVSTAVDSRLESTKAITSSVPKDMVYVTGGCFEMGDTFGEGESDEKPVHRVCLDDFKMDKYEVTQSQFERVMGNNPSRFSSCGACPVEQVIWIEAKEYCEKGNKRLPTEAEWEYAARSGGKSEKYSGGADIDSVAWYRNNSGGKTHPVGKKSANGLGLYDMSGNVWEWVSDRYSKDYYRRSPERNPQGPSSGGHRTLRGGSWYFKPEYVRASDRYGFKLDVRGLFSGFRCSL